MEFPYLDRCGNRRSLAVEAQAVTLDTARMIRVDQAGEFGAQRIYAGQLAVMGDRAPHAGEIAGMAEQERLQRAGCVRPRCSRCGRWLDMRWARRPR